MLGCKRVAVPSVRLAVFVQSSPPEMMKTACVVLSCRREVSIIGGRRKEVSSVAVVTQVRIDDAGSCTLKR